MYPDDAVAKRVTDTGMLHFKGCDWYTSWVVRGEVVGIRAIGDDLWSVQFGPVTLGVLDKRATRLPKPGSKPYGSMQPVAPYRLKQKLEEQPHDTP